MILTSSDTTKVHIICCITTVISFPLSLFESFLVINFFVFGDSNLQAEILDSYLLGFVGIKKKFRSWVFMVPSDPTEANLKTLFTFLLSWDTVQEFVFKLCGKKVTAFDSFFPSFLAFFLEFGRRKWEIPEQKFQERYCLDEIWVLKQWRKVKNL